MGGGAAGRRASTPPARRRVGGRSAAVALAAAAAGAGAPVAQRRPGSAAAPPRRPVRRAATGPARAAETVRQPGRSPSRRGRPSPAPAAGDDLRPRSARRARAAVGRHPADAGLRRPGAGRRPRDRCSSAAARRRRRGRLPAPALGDDRRDAAGGDASGRSRSPSPPTRTRPTVDTEAGVVPAERAAARRPGRGHVQGDGRARRRDEGDGHRPLGELRSVRQLHDPGGDRGADEGRRPLRDDREGVPARGGHQVRPAAEHRLPDVRCRGRGRRRRDERQRRGRDHHGRPQRHQPQRHPGGQSGSDERRHPRVLPQVTEEDVAAAEADLAKQLDTAFAALVANPDTAPDGTTLFPETAVLGEPVPDGDPSTLVGQEVAEFTMSATASGTVIVVDETPIEAVAESGIEAEVDEGYVLVEDSVDTRIGDPEVTGETVEFPATVTALQTRQLDPAELEDLVLGMTPEEATAALAPYGRAEITITPDWATTIPTYDFRVEVTIAGAPAATPKLDPEGEPERFLTQPERFLAQPDAS